MRAMVLAGPDRPLELRDVPVPTVGPNDVLVRVAACGVGLTIVKGIGGARIAMYPRIPGHELAGRVERIGSEVQSVATGDRVTCHFYLTCGQCPMCRSGRESLCPRRRGNVGRAIDGGYAEFTLLPERNVIPVPDGVSDLD